jgi:alpha-mannosidase
MSNLNLDWRKHAVFLAELAPSQMNRFDCALEVLPARPKPTLSAKDGLITIKTPSIEASVNCKTGLVDTFAIGGFEYLKPQAFKLLAIADNEDPWETRYQSFREVAGSFELMSAEESTRFSGVSQGTLDAVRIIEDGDVRTVVEALFRYRDSFAIVHYKFPKSGTEVELILRVHWNEKSTMLKLSVPTVFEEASCLGQVAFGVQQFPATGRENVAQKWLAVASASHDRALTCINNGTYGSDFADGELRLSLLRSAAYSGHPIGERSIVPQDRNTPRIDQGERIFRFWLNAGTASDRMERIDREALIHNEAPFAMSFCPSGAGEKPKPGITLSDSVVQLVTFKQAEGSPDYIARLFEPTGHARATEVTIPALDMTWGVTLSPFEAKTYRINPTTKSVREVTLLEE